MNKQSKWMVSFICLFTGFMVAVQFQTTKAEPEVRDTRDEWEVREALMTQQETRQTLLDKIKTADETIENYNAQPSHEQVETLKETIETLEKKIGLKEVAGSGVLLTISPIFQENLTEGQEYPVISPQLLSRLINELNSFGANEIAIGNERLTNLSPVRNVNGETYMNNRPLPPLPVKVRVLTQQPQELKDYMEASQSKEIFGIENLNIEVEVKNTLTLPKYDAPLRLEIFEETGE